MNITVIWLETNLNSTTYEDIGSLELQQSTFLIFRVFLQALLQQFRKTAAKK